MMIWLMRTFRNYNANLETNLNPFGQQENEEVEDILAQSDQNDDDIESEDVDISNGGSSATIATRPCVLSDEEINDKIRSLNKKQK